ncbi:hypothetical protein PAMA_001590 [Pampus argenteus]
MASLICSETQSRVSSVLNRDVKQYGKKYMFDCNEETCWNSDQGECQWVALEFPHSVKVSELKIQFQGGFSSKTCRLEVKRLDVLFLCPRATAKAIGLYPDHNNSICTHSLIHQQKNEHVRRINENTATFHFRIVVFLLRCLGNKHSQAGMHYFSLHPHC